MPINAHPEYFVALEEVAKAKAKDDKILALEKLLSVAPDHKGAENLRADIKSKISKLKKELEKEKSQKKGGKSKFSIKKTGDAQVVLLGFTNSGKSSLLSILSNAKTKISEWPYTTTIPEIGTMDIGGAKIQIVELPSLKEDMRENTEILALTRTADLIIELVTSNQEIEKVNEILKMKNITTPKLIIGNKEEYIVVTKAEFMISCLNQTNLDRLKGEMIKKLKLIMVKTKEPGKLAAERPIVLKNGARIKEFARQIHKDFIKKFSHALIWGPSARFQGQRVGMDHTLMDGDIIEIYLKK